MSLAISVRVETTARSLNIWICFPPLARTDRARQPLGKLPDGMAERGDASLRARLIDDLDDRHLLLVDGGFPDGTCVHGVTAIHVQSPAQGDCSQPNGNCDGTQGNPANPQAGSQAASQGNSQQAGNAAVGLGGLR